MRTDRGGRLRLGALAVGMFGLPFTGGCGDDDSSSDTLVPLDGVPGASGPSVAPTGDVAASADTAVDPAQAGAGFVSIQVTLPGAGVDETISLDRATVRADALDPVSLDATCSPLDGGDGVTVTVVDHRRLGTGARVMSVAVRVDDAPSAGEHDVTVDVSDADLVTTAYTGTIELAADARSGTFEATGPAGSVLTGSFVCADAPVATSTAPPVTGGGEEVPDTEAPPTG